MDATRHRALATPARLSWGLIRHNGTRRHSQERGWTRRRSGILRENRPKPPSVPAPRASSSAIKSTGTVRQTDQARCGRWRLLERHLARLQRTDDAVLPAADDASRRHDLNPSRHRLTFTHPRTDILNPIHPQDNGGSILAISSPKFAVIAGDTRQSSGYNIETRTAKRVFQLTPETAIAVQGFMGDAMNFVKKLKQRLEVRTPGP